MQKAESDHWSDSADDGGAEPLLFSAEQATIMMFFL